MSDNKQDIDYLLDDDEFARVMTLQYSKDGKPRDALAEKRIWKRLGPSKARWIYSLSILAAVILLLIIVRPPAEDDALKPQVKMGVQKLDIHVEWIENSTQPQIKVQTLQPRFVVIYASADQGQPQRVHEPFQLNGREERVLSLDPAQAWRRVCALTAESLVELKRLETMLDLIWTQMSERQCVTR